MNNPLIEMAGRAVFGNIWSTAIGGGMFWSQIESVAHLLATHPTWGQLLQDGSFQSLLSGVFLIFSQVDHGKLPQFFFKD